MNWIADDLRRRGIAVWNIDYRGVDRPGGGYPGTFLDAAAAADALRDHAARYNLDLSRVVAIGHSAGGHLALWLAARPAAVQRNRGVRIRLATCRAARRRRESSAGWWRRSGPRSGARLGDREIVCQRSADGESDSCPRSTPEFIAGGRGAPT